MNNKSLFMISNFLPQPQYNKNVWHFLAERLSERGWDVFTASDKINPIHRLSEMAWCIFREGNRYSLAEIDVFSGKAFIISQVCSLLLALIQKPIILTLHGGGLPRFAERHPKRVNRVLARANAVISPSAFQQIELKKYRPDIRLIPNPIDVSISVFRLRESPDAKLVWVRAFHECYNPSLAPKVLHELDKDFPEIQLLMVGPDKGDGSLRRMLSLADALGVRDRIKIVGGVPHTEISAWLNKGDIFINTTNFDTAPRSVLEAMANGLCVVSTNVGGLPYMVDHEQEVLLVPPDDAPAMASAIRRLLTEPGLGAKLSRNARGKSENYDWSAILPQWEAVFEQVLKDHYG